MTITASTIVTGVDRDMSMDHFISILQNAHSPAAGAAGPSYLSVANHRVSVAFALAIFKHESRMGMAGIVPEHKLKNPGATRSTRTGKGKAIQIPGRGPFVRYDTWTDGWDDLAFRLVDPAYVYAREGRTTIRQIIERWAPSSDGNVPDSYIAAVVRDMNEWIGEMPPTTRLIDMFDHVPEIDTSQVLTIQDVQGRPNFSGATIHLNGLTVHQTGNPRPGTDAIVHRSFVRNGGGSENVSFHYAVDSERCVQIVDDFVACWHAGDGSNGPGNLTTIAFELCINSDGNYERTLYNAAYLLAVKQQAYNKPDVFQHNHWSGKDCPKQIRQRGEWDWFLQGVADWYVKLDQPETERVVNGHRISGPILAAYKELEAIKRHWSTFGNPISDETGPVEVDGIDRTVQRFDRGWVMSEGDSAVIAKTHAPDQVAQIEAALGIGNDLDKRLDTIRDSAIGILDQVKALQGA